MFRIKVKRKSFLVFAGFAVLVVCFQTLVPRRARDRDTKVEPYSVFEDPVEQLLTEDDLLSVGSEAASNATLGACLHSTSLRQHH